MICLPPTESRNEAMANLPKATKVTPGSEARREVGMDDQNHYTIKIGENEYYCFQERANGPWLVDGWHSGPERREFDSLKKIKEYLAGDSGTTEGSTPQASNPAGNSASMWDGPSITAYFVMFLARYPAEFSGAVREALDKSGWLTEDGLPDYERANRELSAGLI
jgi:hypothetical protein